MIYLTRRERFNAAHKLFNPKWNEEQNETVFGKCANKNWHGHNYHLFVTIKGKANPDTGFVMNVKDLSKLINTYIIDKLDHKNLNLDVDFLTNILPSTENLAIAIWQELQPHFAKLENISLHCVKIYETENIYVEYFGE